MKTQAYKSEHTGELFATKKLYNDHLKTWKNNKKIKKDEITETKLKNIPRLTATSIEDFRQKMFDTITKLNNNKEDKLLGLFFSNFYFTNVSNSHHCPIGGVTNWAERETDKPTSYIGWCVNIHIIYSSEHNTSNERRDLEELVKKFPGFNLGGGGYDGEEYNGIKGYVLHYSLNLYLSDFPVLQKQYDKFISLTKKYNDWKKKTITIINEKNNTDKTIIDYNKQISDYEIKIKKLQDELKSLKDLQHNRSNHNKGLVLSKHKFKKFEETNDLCKSLFLGSEKLLSSL